MNRIAFVLALVLIGGAIGAGLYLRNQSPSAGSSDQPGSAETASSKILNLYMWSDYMAKDTIEKFEQEYGIKVTYDVFDSNEVLEAKLLAGGTGFDIVVPSASFMARQIQAGAFQPLDKTRLTNYANLDAELMNRLAVNDPSNQHGVPYLWGTTGIGYNPDKVREILGDDAPLGSWDLVMKPENLAKLKQCGVAFLDAPTEIIPAALHYLGEDPNSVNVELIAGPALDLLLSLRPHITYLHSSQYINGLANGDICVAVGWSGDILQASEKAAEGVTVEYIIPAEGASMWFDMLAIPVDVVNVDNAHLFIDYLLRPQVIADVSNYVYYANPNPASTHLIKEEITSDPNIYPAQGISKLYNFIMLPPEIERAHTDAWRRFSTAASQ
ncbi:MAG: extracellular solute-binding protein [Gammaproteobacteria bacterium]|nr:extracellular solute-binding protein [Gammaproteobacteria bacterium]